MVVDDPQRLAQYTRALALAKYRAGQPAQAIETLRTLDQPTRSDATPLELAVMAMASQQLGDTKQAQTVLDQFRRLAQTARCVNDQEAQVLLQDAESVVNTATRGDSGK